MKYKSVVLTLALAVSTGNSNYLNGGWVSRYSDVPVNNSDYVDVGSNIDDAYNMKLRLQEREFEEYGKSESKNKSKKKKEDKKLKKENKKVAIELEDKKASPNLNINNQKQKERKRRRRKFNFIRVSTSTDKDLKKAVLFTKATGMINVYKRVRFSFIWLGKNGINPITTELLDIIINDKTLPPTSRSKKRALRYEKDIERLYSRKRKISKRRRVALDMALTRLYLGYSYYRVYGGIRWEKFKAKLKQLTKKYKTKVGWEYYRPPLSPSDILVEAIPTGRLEGVLKRALPRRFKFHQLENKLIEYLDLRKRGGWRIIPPYKTVKPNQKSSIVPKIRERLKLEDELKKCSTPDDINLYDDCMQKGVWRYKIRHGLKPNKIIDKSLRKVLNIPISKKIAKMRLNLDRIKWLYRDEEPLRIELNIPSFRLNLYEHNKIVTTIRVIVGKPNHPTPIFHNVMKIVVVNPYWKIPESIVKHEMLKHLIRDPYYYERKGKILKKSWDENSPNIDPGKVNWRKYYRSRNNDNVHIPYYFIQVPGSKNALGKIKFLFPNKYSVYIHDTPARGLFFKTKRAFSHGCMRIQKPRELLKMLANYNDNINVEEIMKKLGTTEKKTILLTKPVPVDITYLTSFVDDYGNLHFRPDIYKYDKYQMDSYRYPDLIKIGSGNIDVKDKSNKKKESNKQNSNHINIIKTNKANKNKRSKSKKDIEKEQMIMF